MVVRLAMSLVDGVGDWRSLNRSTDIWENWQASAFIEMWVRTWKEHEPVTFLLRGLRQNCRWFMAFWDAFVAWPPPRKILNHPFRKRQSMLSLQEFQAKDSKRCLWWFSTDSRRSFHVWFSPTLVLLVYCIVQCACKFQMLMANQSKDVN